eukprot:jgi/Bigna1/59001/fgenesh1_kg.2_\
MSNCFFRARHEKHHCSLCLFRVPVAGLSRKGRVDHLLAVIQINRLGVQWHDHSNIREHEKKMKISKSAIADFQTG